MTKTKFILRCAGYAVGKIAGLVLALTTAQGCKATPPVRYSPIQNDRYYAINQTIMPLYVIRHDTWTVEETDVHDLQDPKFSTELEAEEMIARELLRLLYDTDRHYYAVLLTDCLDRIKKLEQQSGNLQK